MRRRGFCKTRSCSLPAAEAPWDEAPAQGGPEGPICGSTGLAKAPFCFLNRGLFSRHRRRNKQIRAPCAGEWKARELQGLVPSSLGGGAVLIMKTGPERAGGGPVVTQQVSHIEGGTRRLWVGCGAVSSAHASRVGGAAGWRLPWPLACFLKGTAIAKMLHQSSNHLLLSRKDVCAHPSTFW